ncbi:MAG TPA: cyclopropane-fatty-acyl-phospholipid synthase family protein [Nocardioidaceae bacterium]|nr:cyclopropane-fatty-acyl-phospholipid synthase family protein [Nocardioidaceae bacterium]
MSTTEQALHLPSAADELPTAPAYSWRAAIAKRVLRRILYGVPVTARLATGEVYGVPDAHGPMTPYPVGPTLQIDDVEAFFARVAKSPNIGIGESYMAGEWHAAEGTDLADVLAPFAARVTELVKPFFYKMRHLVLPRDLNPNNSKAGARRNIAAHYDVSNDMFGCFLDPTWSYSCALFDRLHPVPAFEDLKAAQIRKTEAILDAAGVVEGTRVLEIGTGWGTLAIRAAERGAHVCTVTISTEQAALARARVQGAGVADRVDIALRDYRDVEGEFDAIVSVEMIEAVGEQYWSTYFTAIDRLLAPGGRVAIQAILLEHDRMLATRNTYTWIHKYIFPGGTLPSLQAIDETLAARTSLRRLTTTAMGQHYAHTLRLWRQRFCANWPQVRALGFDERFRRMWEFYLAYCEAGFRVGYLDVAQISLGR